MIRKCNRCDSEINVLWQRRTKNRGHYYLLCGDCEIVLRKMHQDHVGQTGRVDMAFDKIYRRIDSKNKEE